METTIATMPHPELLNGLFAFKSKVSKVFMDVLGIHNLNHIAITKINSNREILAFSSTPALEFNLFSSNLWRYDKTYHPSWFQKAKQSSWESLYLSLRYEELYYLKQTKHHYLTACSLGEKVNDDFFIYSLATTKTSQEASSVFMEQDDDFYKIGQYCAKQLAYLFIQSEDFYFEKSTQVIS